MNKFEFDNIKDCPLIKKIGAKPSYNSTNYHCDGFEDSWWLPTVDPRCEKCKHLKSFNGNGETKDYE